MAEDYREKIKSRVRKLLNLAGDNAAFEGEIANAMQAAEALMEAHQLSRAEVMAQRARRPRSERRPNANELRP